MCTVDQEITAEGDAGSVAGRGSSLASRREAVERVIRMMWKRYPDPLSLEDMARTALFSRYHFNRVFRHVTGLPPGRFLAAIRLATAKRLLLTTGYSVTAICFEVGYNSVGTFTSHFTRYVGVPPHRLRNIPAGALAEILALGWLRRPSGAHGTGGGHEVVVRLSAPADPSGPIFVGLFATPIPRGRPLACAVAAGPGALSLSLPGGGCYAFALRLPVSEDPATTLMCEGMPRGHAGPLPPAGDHPGGSPLELALRLPTLIDPPVLVALPFLLAERLHASETALVSSLLP